MPIVSAVVHVTPDGRALPALAAMPELTLGQLARSTRLPVVADTRDAAHDDALWERILSTDGVLHVDVLAAVTDEEVEHGSP